MSLEDDDGRPAPVEGAEFPTSAAKALSGVLGGFLLTGLSLLVILWRLDVVRLLDDRRPGLFITIAAGFVALLGPFLVVHSLLQMVRKRRLVLGADRLQLIDTRGGRDVVVAQVMYANVAGLVLVNDEGVKQINVKLEEHPAEGTYDAANAVRPWKNKGGFDFVVANAYKGSLRELLEALDEAVMGWRAKQEG